MRENLRGLFHPEDLRQIEGMSVPPAAAFVALGGLWATMRREAQACISHFDDHQFARANEGLLNSFSPFLSRASVLLRFRLALESEVERARVPVFRETRPEEFEYRSRWDMARGRGASGKSPRR